MTAYHRMAPLLSILVCVAASAQATPQSALVFFQNGQYEKALHELQSAVHAHPNDAAIHNFIGITETKLGRLEAADLEYKVSSSLDPTLQAPVKNLGFNYLNTGEYALAEELLKKALALDPSDAFTHYYLAILYLSTGRATEAIPHVKPAEDLLGNDAPTAVLAIHACLELSQSEEALHLIRALERGGLLSFAQEYELAQLLTQQRMYTDAVPRFERLVHMQPKAWENRYNLAGALLRAKQPEDARMLLTGLASERPAEANILSMLGSAYDLELASAPALKAYQQAIAADPANPDRYLECTRAMIDQEHFSDAVALLQTGITRVPDPYTLIIRLGAIEMMQGSFGKARSDFNEAVRQHPDVALGYVALAQTYIKEGNSATAIEVLTDGRAKVTRDFALEYVLGLIFFEAGRPTEAQDALKNAEGLGPEVVEPHYQLGLLYMQQQQWKGAQAEFESVLRLNPSHAASHYQLSRVYQRLGDTKRAREMAADASSLTRTQREDAIKTEQLRLGIPAGPQQP